MTKTRNTGGKKISNTVANHAKHIQFAVIVDNKITYSVYIVVTV